jgi:hypothetical protein
MRYRHLALLVLALGACRDAPQSQASTASALPFLPIPPKATVLSRATSPNAVQISFQSSDTPSEVLDYYRKSLPATGWSLESDAEDAEGAYALYALKDGHPIWIRISQTPGMPGSVISLNGAVIEPPATTTDTAAGASSGN